MAGTNSGNLTPSDAVAALTITPLSGNPNVVATIALEGVPKCIAKISLKV